MTSFRRLWGCLTLATLLLPLLAVGQDKKKKPDAAAATAAAATAAADAASRVLQADNPALKEARGVAEQQLFDMAVRHLATRLKETKTDGFSYLEQEIGFSPSDTDFSLDLHSYADLSDAAKLHVALHARDRAEKGTGPLVLAALGKRLSLNDREGRTQPNVATIREYLQLRMAVNPKFDPREASTMRLSFQYPKPPKRPALSADFRARLGVLARYLSDPRNGGPVAALQRYLGLTQSQAHGLLWECGSLSLVLELAMANSSSPKDEMKEFLGRIMRDAEKRKDTTLERVAALWPDREIEGADELTPPIKAVGPKQPEPPAAVMKPQERGAEFEKYGKDAGSMKPADVKKRAAYPNGLYYGIEVRSEDLPTPAEVRYEPNAKDAAKGKLVVTFKNKKSERSLLNVNPEEARAAWEMLYGKDALKDGDGTPILGLEQGGGSYHEIGKTEIRRTARRDVIVHPALLDTELAQAGIRVELLANNRGWLHAELDADESLGAKDSHARDVMKQMVEWAFDPWRNLDVFYRRQRLSVFRLVDVPLVIKPGVQDAALRVMRDGEDYDEMLRSRVFISMLLHVQPVKDDSSPKGDAEEVKKFAKESYAVMGDLLKASPELQRLNNFAAVLGVVRWAKSKGATFAEPQKPKGGPRTPESLAVFSDLVVPLARVKPDEVRKAEGKRLEDKLTELRKTAALKKYDKAWETWWEAADKEDAAVAQTAAAVLRESEADVKLFDQAVRMLYVDRVEELTRKHRGKDGKTNRQKLRADFDKIVEEVNKKKQTNPAEAAVARFALEDMKARLFPKGDDDA